jgi:hypothetical protein
MTIDIQEVIDIYKTCPTYHAGKFVISFLLTNHAGKFVIYIYKVCGKIGLFTNFPAWYVGQVL